jgi:Na+/melibiose symporter-like transporter
LASLFAFYPYRCAKCAHRFLRFRYASEVTPPGVPSSTDQEIKSTRAAIRWKGKRREFLVYGVGVLLIIAFLYFITRERSPSDGN